MKSKCRQWLIAAGILVTLLPWAGHTLAGPTSQMPLGTDAALVPGNDTLISRAIGVGRGLAAAAYNDDLDNYLVVWADARGSATDWDIYGQFFSSDGIPFQDNFAIRNETDHLLVYPDVAYDSVNQKYLVIWEDGTEDDIEGVLLNPDGTMGSSFNISQGDVNDPRQRPAVASYAHAVNGTYLVAYMRGLAGNHNIYAQLVGVDGTVTGGEIPVSTRSNDQDDPDLAVNPTNGDFLVVWEDGYTDPDSIFSRIVDWSGTMQSPMVVSSTTVPRYNPAVAFDPGAGADGEWLVVFERDANGDSQIGGRRVGVDGSATGDGIRICDDAADQLHPRIAYNANNDQYLVTWTDQRDGTTNWNIYGRRVQSSGELAGGILAISTAPGQQLDAALAASPTAPGYLVAFTDGRTFDIEGQLVSAQGTLEGHQFTISAPVNDQQMSSIAFNSTDGEYLVVWQDERSGTSDIWGQRMDLDGGMLGDNLLISSGNHVLPDVAYNPDTNQYLVVWDDRTWYRIYGQRVNADGSLDGSEIPIAISGTGHRRQPQVTYNPISGEYFVVFVYESLTEGDNIHGRRVPASSDPVEPEIYIATGPSIQDRPDVACRAPEGGGGGGYLVVWHEEDGGENDVKGQRVSQTGSLQGDVLGICTQADDQWIPRVAYSPIADRYLVTWPDDRNSTTQGRDIYGRQVGGLGALLTVTAISTAAEDQAHVAVTYGSGLGNFVVTWDDDRYAATAPDIYGQQVSNGGVLVDTTASENELYFAYSGWQQRPDISWGGNEATGLLVWEDGRNGESFHAYGLQLGYASYRVFLPLVVREN